MPALRPFVSILDRDHGDDGQWVAALTAIVSQKPPDVWKDMDVKAFSPLMHDIGQRFLALEALMHAEQDHPPEARDAKEPRLLTLARPGAE